MGKEDLSKRKDCFDRDKLIASRTYGKDDLELLKKITRKFRPPCHFCEGICGIVWYEFKDKLNVPEIIAKEKHKGRNIQKSEEYKDYSMVLCTSCFY